MIKNDDLLTLFVPENFIPENYIPRNTSRKEELRDAMNFIVAQYIKRMISEKGRDEFTNTGGIRLSTKLFDRTIGRTYKRAIELLERNVLEVCKTEKAKRCRSYRLYPQFMGNTKTVIIERELTVRRINKELDKQRYQTQQSPAFSILEKWLRNPGFSNNNEPETQYYIEMLKQTLSKKAKDYVQKHLKNESYFREIQFRIASRFYSQKLYLNLVEKGNFELSRDDKGGRIYHPLTSMFKGLRHFYSFEGQQLSSLDIKSSQPYLFLALLQRSFWEKEGQNTLYRFRQDIYQELEEIKAIDDIIMVWDSQHGLQSAKAFPLINAVLTGDIYMQVADQLNQGNSSFSSTFRQKRERGKRMTMWFMYDNFSRKRPPPYLKFKQKFPVESQIMEVIKRGRHERFPILLQAIEAHIILERIVPRISAQFPDLPLYTVHDSIITLTSHVEVVKNIMVEELQNFVGKPATVSVEHLSPDVPLTNIDAEAQLMFDDIIHSISTHKTSFRAIGEFPFDLRTMNTPWKKVMPRYGSNQLLGTKWLPEEDNEEESM